MGHFDGKEITNLCANLSLKKNNKFELKNYSQLIEIYYNLFTTLAQSWDKKKDIILNRIQIFEHF